MKIRSNVNKRIPVTFEKVQEYSSEDSRFQKVKIWLMHLGKNYNNSIFTKEVVEEAMDTLKNTPILGYIEESKLGDKDFRGHEVELVVEEGELKVKYVGQAYGLIPESCNPRFEEKMGDHGDMLTYLVVDGLLWTKFDDAVSILDESEEVAQSMELHDEFDGYWDDEGFFNFTKISFYGACMLGKDVLPAMQRASVEKVFTASVIQDEIAKKLKEFNSLMNVDHSKEVEHEVNLEELLAKYSITIEDLEEKGITDVENYGVSDLEEKIKELFSDDSQSDNSDDSDDSDDDNDVTNDDSSNDDDEKFSNDDPDNDDINSNNDDTTDDDGSQEDFSIKFELSHDDIRRKMWDSIDGYMESKGLGEDWYYIVSVYDNYIIVENDMGSKFYKVDYSKENDVISYGEVVEVHPMFLTSDEKGALELMRSNFEKLEEENKELKSFKESVMKQSHESDANELFSKFNKLSEEDIKDIKENVHEFSLEEIEAKLFERLGRKLATFKKKEEDKNIKIKLGGNPDEDRSGYSHLFSKYGKKPNN